MRTIGCLVEFAADLLFVPVNKVWGWVDDLTGKTKRWEAEERQFFLERWTDGSDFSDRP